MPSYWYSIRDNIPKEYDTEKEIEIKDFNKRISAANKPYFMTYVYPELRIRNKEYINNNNNGVALRFGHCGAKNLADLYSLEEKTPAMSDYLNCYEKYITTGNNPCIVNRICWNIEKTLNKTSISKLGLEVFDYSIMKSDAEYSKQNYSDISILYEEYKYRFSSYLKKVQSEKIDSFEAQQQRAILISFYKNECERICPNEYELCNIVLDLCYKAEKNKQFAWDICGHTILKNLLNKNGNIIHYPSLSEGDGDFEYCGERFSIFTKEIERDCFE